MEGLLELVYPPACVACDEVLPGHGFFCEACAPLVLEVPAIRCRVCSEPGRFPEDRCPRCTSTPPPFREAFAPFEHEGAVARAIHRFKYEQRPDLARPLAWLLAYEARDLLTRLAGALVPLSLHERRYRERGYDQATLLAVELGAALRRPVHDEWLMRHRETRRQVGLTELEREANVRGAFEASSQARGQTVLLVDDVFTTGATAAEAARCLLKAGAQEVAVVTLARQRREHDTT